VSDLLDRLSSLLDGLHRLRVQRHDVIVLHLMDRDEWEFPFEKPTLFRGLEQQNHLLADPTTLRQAYRAEVDYFVRALRRGCRQHEIELYSLRTDQPFDAALSALLSRRSKRKG
jgi:hypothetical protein